MERITIELLLVVLFELSFKQAINGSPLELVDLTNAVDDIVHSPKERIVFASVPLTPANQSKIRDDLIMAPKPRNYVINLPLEPSNQTNIKADITLEPKPHQYFAKVPLERAYHTTTDVVHMVLKEPTFFKRLPLQSNLTTAINHVVKAHKRRGIFTGSSEYLNLTSLKKDFIAYTPKPRGFLGRLVSNSTNLTSMDDRTLISPKPDNIFAVLPVESANLTNFMDDIAEVERILSESRNLTRMLNRTVQAPKPEDMFIHLARGPANLTEVMDGVVGASKTRGIFGEIPPSPYRTKLNMSDDTVKTTKPRGIFAKIPQDMPPEDSNIVSLISEVPNAPDLGLGYSNQIAKLNGFPPTSFDKTLSTNDDEFNIPLSTQPFDKYKLLVVKAPPEIQMSSPDTPPWVIYVVFPQGNTTGNLNLPTIYFVNKLPEIHDKKIQQEPIFVIDPNRKVTGLKSNDIEKFIKFKSKLTSTLDYNKS